MKDFYKELLTEIDVIGESNEIETAVFTYGCIWGKTCLARELRLISADQMTDIQAEADAALEDWKTYFL